jgi:pyridoxamine 5'-phosphate oxidase
VTRRTPNTRLSTVDLAAERREYLGQRLLEGESPVGPDELFTTWLDQALAAGLLDATAMVLSTSTSDGVPSARVVLLKGRDPRGLVFYTRHHTQKTAELAENPRASCLFHWRELDRQVRFDGTVEPVSAEESRVYFSSRPRSSQLAARATSGLSRVTAEALERHFAEAVREWDGRDVEMPADWGGFRVTPRRVEFWQGRPNRLHDRLVYERGADGTWARHRLAP